MKKETLMFLSFFSILFFPVVKAQTTIAEFFYYFDAQTIFITVIFIVIALMIKFSLGKTSMDNKMVVVLSLAISLLATYGINKWIDVNGIVSGLGISDDILIIILFLAVIVFLFVYKWKSFMVLGLIFIGISFTDWVAESETLLIIGIVFLVIGIIWWFWSWRRGYGAQPSSTAVVNGMPRLIAEAKAYRKWADRQQNPKMYRSWAHFINYLKSRGYGNSEKEICQRINVSSSDLSSIVKKYIL